MKPTLDRPATYQIIVPGELDPRNYGWEAGKSTDIDVVEGGQTVTKITGRFDQASLHSLLRLLYTMGIPLISVHWMFNEEIRCRDAE